MSVLEGIDNVCVYFDELIIRTKDEANGDTV